MAVTGPIDSWNNNPLDVGPIYPFAGWEVLMFAVCVAFCIAFIVWKLVTESAKYASAAQTLRESGRLNHLR